MLEMRVEFKRLAVRIQKSEDLLDARHSLTELIQAALSRDTSSDDTDLLCEVFQGLNVEVAKEVSL